MKSKLETLVNKNKGKIHIQEYVDELSKLFPNSIELIDILALEETSSIRDSIIKRGWNESRIIRFNEIPFFEKDFLKRFFSRVEEEYREGFFVSLGYSEYCGYSKIPHLNCFNVNFDFEDEHTGLIMFHTLDRQNSIVIDFYEEYETKFYDLKVYCGSWDMNKLPAG